MMNWSHEDKDASFKDGEIRNGIGGIAAEGDKSTNHPVRRLSDLVTPAVGKKQKRRRTHDSTMTASKIGEANGKGTGSGRKKGKLAQILDMPLDILFEITAHLEPFDILRLSRISKEFRATFASNKHSRHIWIAARRNITMPECPKDLTELQYASLMFEQSCQACGSRAYKVDYSLRVRFCGPCFEANVQAGTKIIRRHCTLISYPEIFTLVPRSSLQNPNNYSTQPLASWSSIPGGDAMTNGRRNAYYVPEIEMVIGRYKELRTDHAALRRFVEQQQTLASYMMDNAANLAEWAKLYKTQKVTDRCESVKNREASLEAKLLELGWEKKDFPSEHSKWRALMKQPRELTPHLWKILRPKLETLLKEHKAAQAQAVIRIRRDQREWELQPFWDDFVVSYSWDAAPPWALPRFVDACELPAINKMLSEDESKIPVTVERWREVVDSVPEDLAEFANQVKRDVIRLLTVSDLKIDSIDADVSNDADPSIFDRASSLISCGVAGCQNLLTFPAILQEDHVTPYHNHNFQDRKWPDLLSRLRHEPEVSRAVSLVLQTLGLSNDTPLVAFDGFDRKLVCLCGNPKFRQPVDFRSLIRHIADETKTFESQVRTRRNTSYARDVVLSNDHDLTGPEPRITLLSFDDVCKLKSDGDSKLPGIFYRYYERYCKDCWILNRRLDAMTDDADVAYHMRAKHLKEVGEEDALTMRELKRWKKKHPGH